MPRGLGGVTTRTAALLEPLQWGVEAYVFGSWVLGKDQAHVDIGTPVYVAQAGLSERGCGYRAKLASELTRSLNGAVGLACL